MPGQRVLAGSRFLGYGGSGPLPATARLREMRTGHGLLAMLAFLAAGMTACGSSPASPPAGPGTSRDARALAAEYLAIATPANHRLEGEENGYTASAHRNLAAAESALRAQAATERWFD